MVTTNVRCSEISVCDLKRFCKPLCSPIYLLLSSSFWKFTGSKRALYRAISKTFPNTQKTYCFLSFKSHFSNWFLKIMERFPEMCILQSYFVLIFPFFFKRFDSIKKFVCNFLKCMSSIYHNKIQLLVNCNKMYSDHLVIIIIISQRFINLKDSEKITFW